MTPATSRWPFFKKNSNMLYIYTVHVTVCVDISNKYVRQTYTTHISVYIDIYRYISIYIDIYQTYTTPPRWPCVRQTYTKHISVYIDIYRYISIYTRRIQRHLAGPAYAFAVQKGHASCLERACVRIERAKGHASYSIERACVRIERAKGMRPYWKGKRACVLFRKGMRPV
jgi:hypothetical protein